MNTNPIPEKLKETEDFKQYLSTTRDEFVVAINSDFAVMDVDKRVKVENLLIAYDNMRNQLADYQLAEGEKWISVDDRLPENGRDVLVGDDESDIVCTAWYSSFEECFNRQVAGMNITHWRELPTPPVK